MLSYVHKELVSKGYRVWYDQNEMGVDIANSMKLGISNSKVVLACVNSFYQSRENCLIELREAVATQKTLVTLVIEDNPFAWANEEIKTLCEIKTKMFINIGNQIRNPLDWESDEGPTIEMINSLKVSLLPLYKVLDELKCYPSMKHGRTP
jgi:hypothetical protein